jgi:hypothetical protein
MKAAGNDDNAFFFYGINETMFFIDPAAPKPLIFVFQGFRLA